MDYEINLKNINNKYSKYVLNIDKNELSKICLRKNKDTRFYNIFNPNYYKRNKLVKYGKIIYGYVFKVFNDTSIKKISIGYVIHSPNLKFNNNPELYKNIYDKLDYFLNNNKDKKYNKLKNILTKNFAELHYFLLPKELVNNEELIYISTFPLILNNINLGINYFISNLKYSNEILMITKDIMEKIL